MARTSDLQDLTGDHLWSGGLPMAAMLGLGDHLWQPHSVQGTDYGIMGDHRWHDRPIRNSSYLTIWVHL